MILMSSVLKNSLLGQHFKSQFFDLWRELALKQRKKYIKNGKKLLCNIKIIFFVKNAWQNGSYEIKDNEIVTSYRTARSGRNRNGFLLTKYENIIGQAEWCMWLINIYINIFKTAFWKCNTVVIKNIIKVVDITKNAKNKYLNDLKHDKNKYLNNPPIIDNISRKMIISIKFSKI